MPKILIEDEIAEGMTPLSSRHREIFSVVHTWAKYYARFDGIMLNQCTHFFQVVEVQVNLIWLK